MSESILQFNFIKSTFSSQFWFTLAKLKLEAWKLDNSSKKVLGSLKTNLEFDENSVLGSGAETERVDQVSLESVLETCNLNSNQNSRVLQGILKNTNTLEEFKEFDKLKFQREITEIILRNIKSDAFLKDPSVLNMFGLLTFSDLKKYRFIYWFLLPALVPKEPFLVKRIKLNENLTESQCIQLKNIQMKLEEIACIFHIDSNGDLKKDSLENWGKYDFNTNTFICYRDDSCLGDAPGWNLRNFLYAIKLKWKIAKVCIILLQKSDQLMQEILEIKLPGHISEDLPESVGWERNNNGKMAPKMVDLSGFMDPIKLAETAVDLNLKLIKWRAMPNIPLDKISNVKCLLFGAGTLGCYTARALMAWGVRHITFVDSGKVSFSNPVRQPLFSFEDCLDGGVDKAIAASKELKAIYPGITSHGHVLNIPMPGHPLKDSQDTRNLFKKIEDLIQEHDAIFLLTDSRESRWLPALIGASQNKIVMNAALGFDSFLVMRHGARQNDQGNLGCYFCNDVVAPTDSLKDRTLDQQCTVTRPGLSLIASSLVTELFISILCHPLGIDAPADLSQDPSTPIDYSFGLVPHQIRGFLTHYSNLLIKGHAFNKCTACSNPILKAYQESGIDFILSVINDSSILETVSGLREMFEATQSIDVEWDDE